MRTIHIEGTIKDQSDNWGTQIEIRMPDKRFSYSLSEVMTENIVEGMQEVAESTAKDENEDELIGVDISVNIPNIGLRIYSNRVPCTLEAAIEHTVLATMGCLDIYQVDTGYSEYTIMGYDTENFKLISENGGEHDLNAIFASLDGKYVHIVIDVM